MPELPVDPELRPPYRRRELLRVGTEARWWLYESENPAGWRDAAGVDYLETSYTVKLPGERRLTLLAGEVEGFVIREALLHEGGMERIAFRDGLLTR